MWQVVRMWWIVQLLRWYGPEQSRFELQGRIAKEYDISGVEKQMIEQFGADAYGSSVRAKAAMDFARDGTEPKLRKKTLVNDYVYFWLWRWWKPEIESPRFARWRTNATRAIESAKSRKHRLIEEKDSMVWLTEYGTKFGIFHLLTAVLGELEPLRQRMSGWKQLLYGAGSVGLLWLLSALRQ